MHKFELADGAIEIARTDRIRHGFKITQRLERDDFEPEIGRQKPGITRLAVEEGQIVLEQFDGAKTGLRRRGQFTLQGAAHADGCDRPSEHPQNLLWTEMAGERGAKAR